MNRPRIATACLGVPAVLCLIGASALGRQQPQGPGPASDVVKWNLAGLNKAPLKLIKSTPDPLHRQVRFLVEFSRRPELSELFDWEHRGGPVTFRFLDEDGVALKSVRPQVEGELVPEAGTRIRFVLPLPDERTLAQTYSVVAE